MIKLKGVSKFYYSKGMISSGFNRVNLELNQGEFVVITGESGSGKTTLLNVISGLDSYEEGEVYIDGQETSHYSANDWQEYRKTYISNIFQNFNLIMSYTVYQNVELILLINGCKKEEIPKRVKDIVAKVGLTEYLNTKASKLSGGQKQRVSIARALAKDTPIVVADEPTGNLDSASAAEVIKVLGEVSKDKLVIVVTHNYDQFEGVATRIVRMNDGRITEDKMVEQPKVTQEIKHFEHSNMKFPSVLALGKRNAFNIVSKFVLLLIVFLFVVFSVSGIYTSFAASQSENSMLGWNNFFNNASKDRIVLKKSDESAFTKDDIKTISDISGVKAVQKNDILLDTYFSADVEGFYLSGFAYSSAAIVDDITYGTLPTKDNEVMITVMDSMLYNIDPETLVGSKMELRNDGTSDTYKVKITAICVLPSKTQFVEGKIYVSNALMEKMRYAAYAKLCKATYTVGGHEYQYTANANYGLAVSNKVPEGKLIVPVDMANEQKDGTIKGKTLAAEIDSKYFNKSGKFTISDTYDEDNYNSKTGYDFDETYYYQYIFMNEADFKKLFSTNLYQTSVFAESTYGVDKLKEKLESKGYVALSLKDALFGDAAYETIISIIQTPLIVILIIAIFFIAYFVTRLILKSRGVYFSILRILGLTRKISKRILDVELWVISTIAYAVFLLVLILGNVGILSGGFIDSLVLQLGVGDCIALYIIIEVMVWLISTRFSRKMFKSSAMQSYREEA